MPHETTIARRDAWLREKPNERSVHHFMDDDGKDCIQLCEGGVCVMPVPKGGIVGVAAGKGYYEALKCALDWVGA